MVRVHVTGMDDAEFVALERRFQREVAKTRWLALGCGAALAALACVQLSVWNVAGALYFAWEAWQARCVVTRS